VLKGGEKEKFFVSNVEPLSLLVDSALPKNQDLSAGSQNLNDRRPFLESDPV
jgi:hypothetical protein